MVLGGCRCFGGDFECVLLIECCNEFPCCFLPICLLVGLVQDLKGVELLQSCAFHVHDDVLHSLMIRRP